MGSVARVTGLLFLISAHGVNAQSAPDPVAREAQRIQERETQRQADREEQFREALQAPPSGQEVAPEEIQDVGESNCVAIRQAILKGMTRYRESEFAAEVGGLVGDCISIGAINTALRVITNRYISDGFVTSRAFVGPQDLQDGILEIVIVEGSVSEIVGGEGGYSPQTLSMAFAGLKGRQLNLRALEQGVDQLSRLGSYEPNIDVEPGALPGSSNVLVTRKKLGRWFRPYVALDNDGSTATGRFQANAGLDVDNLLGLADAWSVYYSRDLKGNPNIGNESMGGFASLPIGWWTLSISGGRFTYKSILEGNDQAFSNDGESWNASVTVDRMLFRDSKTKLSIAGGFALLDTENRIQGITLSSSSYRQVNGTVNLRLQRRLPEAIIGLDIGFAKGLSILGAEAADTGPNGPTIKASRINAALTYQTKLKLGTVPLDYSVVFRGQAALDPVFSNGRFSLGGSSTVRGFRDDGISGRYGIFVRQQLGFPVLMLFKEGSAVESRVSGFLGYDSGAIIAHNSDRFERGGLHAATLGFRMNNRYMQVELAASKPIYAPDFVQSKPVEFAGSVRVSF